MHARARSSARFRAHILWLFRINYATVFIFKWKLQLFRRVFVRMIGGVYIRIEINHIRSALKPEKKKIITGNPTWREWKFNVWRILSYKTYIYLITYLLRILEWFQIKTWILSII